MLVDSIIVGSGDFITSTTTCYRSAYTSELCGVLAALQSIDYCLSQLHETTMIDISAATDCLGVTRRLERLALVITMSTKLHHIVRDFLHVKSKRFKPIEFVKLDAYQDDLKSFENLCFFEQLNV